MGPPEKGKILPRGYIYITTIIIIIYIDTSQCSYHAASSNPAGP